jgi:hypothetical protein
MLSSVLGFATLARISAKADFGSEVGLVPGKSDAIKDEKTLLICDA